MSKKLLIMGITTGLLLCFFLTNNAIAARIELTLGWHNLLDDFYIVAKDADQGFSVGDQIKGNKLNHSVLIGPGSIDIRDLNLAPGVYDTLGVDTSSKFDKWINKKSNTALKIAAKTYQKETTGKNRGWRTAYNDWQGQDLWDLYQNQTLVAAAFDKMVEGKKVKGKIGGQQFVASMDIFRNPFIEDNPGQTPTAPVPEPATMILLGVGLLGTSIMGRKLKK